jgi:hypothetical protein
VGDDWAAVLEMAEKREATCETMNASTLRHPLAEVFWRWLVQQREYGESFGADLQVAWSAPWERGRQKVTGYLMSYAHSLVHFSIIL